MGRFAICVLLFSVALQASEPENTTVIGVNRDLSDGARALQLKDYDEGIRLTLAGLKFESSRRNRASGLSNLCAGYTALKQFADAIENCNLAIETDANNWHAFNNRALAYLGQGKIDAAKRDVQGGLRLNPDSRKLHEVADMIDAEEKAAPTDIDN